jgi:hypothetical protein
MSTLALQPTKLIGRGQDVAALRQRISSGRSSTYRNGSAHSLLLPTPGSPTSVTSSTAESHAQRSKQAL